MTLRWHGTAVKAHQKAAAARGLLLAAEHLLQASRAVVPIEEATLERSGVASVDIGRLEAAVSYDTPYAVAQHELLDQRHDAGRQAKYLEGPAAEGSGTIARIIAREMKV